jgi:hypothetical protein
MITLLGIIVFMENLQRILISKIYKSINLNFYYSEIDIESMMRVHSKFEFTIAIYDIKKHHTMYRDYDYLMWVLDYEEASVDNSFEKVDYWR